MLEELKNSLNSEKIKTSLQLKVVGMETDLDMDNHQVVMEEDNNLLMEMEIDLITIKETNKLQQEEEIMMTELCLLAI